MPGGHRAALAGHQRFQRCGAVQDERKKEAGDKQSQEGCLPEPGIGHRCSSRHGHACSVNCYGAGMLAEKFHGVKPQTGPRAGCHGASKERQPKSKATTSAAY
jgi:hypothetical protein